MSLEQPYVPANNMTPAEALELRVEAQLEQTKTIGKKTTASPDTWIHFSSIRIPKDFLKDVSFGRSFTTIDAYYIIEQLSLYFGVMGVGWGVTNVRHTVNGKNMGCKATFWFLDPATGERGEIHDVTGDAQVINGNVAEAEKKSLTNFISKCSSMLGLGLGIYLGLGMDDPYLDRKAASSSVKPEEGLRTSATEANTIEQPMSMAELSATPVPAFTQKNGKTFWRAGKKHTLNSYYLETRSPNPDKRWPNNLISEIEMMGHKFGGEFCHKAIQYLAANSTKEHLASAIAAGTKHFGEGWVFLEGEVAKATPANFETPFDDDDVPF